MNDAFQREEIRRDKKESGTVGDEARQYLYSTFPSLLKFAYEG